MMNANELQKIIHAAELVNSNLDVYEVLNNIVNVAVELTNADRGTLYFVDNQKNALLSFVLLGDEIREIRLKIGEGLAGYVAATGETVNIKDVRKDSRFNPKIDRSSGYTTKNMLCFPIKNSEKETVGVLQLLNNLKGGFTERDEELLKALSIHSAIALNNAQMHKKQILVNEELKKAYSELELAKKEAEKFAMLKNHFLLQMSHEIRTPFNIILNSLALLKSKATKLDSDEVKELFAALENGTDRIIRTVDEIMELSEIRSGYYEIHPEPIKLEEDILVKVIKNFKHAVEKKNIYLVYDKTTDKNEINCDKFMITQIFQEIIDNAVKFTSKGDVRIRQFTNAEGKLTVTVKDTGIGMSEEYLEHIFEPFSQEYTGYTRKFEGNGLALALVKKYADLNNLAITVMSQKNVGTEFTIVFN
ncbi:MAG: GAF domain-containing sensor histidine kinase [Bacteroidetes bacterium]|nr:GAF domain-containing sensor histidine kinase [Bacteroidota bacterium]